jgi:hypothetical protein
VVGIVPTAARPLILIIGSHATFEILVHVLASCVSSCAVQRPPALAPDEKRDHGWRYCRRPMGAEPHGSCSFLRSP